MKQHIPNILTLINLFCGCCATVFILNERFETAFLLLITAFVADAFDGRVARWLKVSSPLGKELDSLADMVSFGVAQGAILYMLLKKSLACTETVCTIALFAFVLSCFGGLRLAKYNIDTRQSETFIGLATPACTVFMVGLYLIIENNSFNLGGMLLNPYILGFIVILFSYLMIAEIPMFNFRFKGYAWKGNEFRYIFIISLVLTLLLNQSAFFSISIILYILFSIIQNAMLE